jgi:hypothetical protein
MVRWSILRNWGQVDHKSFQCKNRFSHNGGNNGNGTGANFCLYCRKPGHDKKSCFKLKKKKAQNFNGNADRQLRVIRCGFHGDFEE